MKSKFKTDRRNPERTENYDRRRALRPTGFQRLKGWFIALGVFAAIALMVYLNFPKTR